MRVEHVVVSIIIFLVVLLAALILLGKIFPTFKTGLDFVMEIVRPK